METEPKRPRRRVSRELPPRMSELMNTLIKYSHEFIRQFDSSEDEMRRIVGEFHQIADEVREIQEKRDTARTMGAVAAGVALIGLIFAAFTGGLSSALTAAAAAAAVGSVVVVGAKVTKMMKEQGSARKTEKLGKDFTNIIEPMKKTLEEIKTTCEELEDQSQKHQAEETLRNMEEFRDTMRQVSELKTGALKIVTTKSSVNDVDVNVNSLLGLLLSVPRFTPTSEKSAKLRASIIRSSHQCELVTDELEKMRDRVKAFTGQ